MHGPLRLLHDRGGRFRQLDWARATLLRVMDGPSKNDLRRLYQRHSVRVALHNDFCVLRVSAF